MTRQHAPWCAEPPDHPFVCLPDPQAIEPNDCQCLCHLNEAADEPYYSARQE